MNKNAIQKYAIWARNELIEQVKQRAYQNGITDKGYGDENATVISGRVLSDVEREQRKGFVVQIKEHGFQQAVEEVAYTWFNRFVALRYMEVNDYLPTHVRVFSDANGGFNPEILRDVLHLELPGLDRAKVSELLNANKTEELYRYLLLTQCNALNNPLPEMFEKLGSYTEMLLPNNILGQESVLGRLVKDIPEEDWRDAVQIIGWLYQYYNTEPKQAVFDGLKKNIKITKEKIPAATQLFTPDWIVRYMVENSLGRLWLESHSNSGLRANWNYYLDEAEQTPEVTEKLRVLRAQSPVKSPEDIRLIDPCMGSGHILVYAFDVLMQIYESEGYNPGDAAKLILEKNIYGLDIDRRAYQLAWFALMMKARQYSRRIFTENVKPQVYHPADWSDGEEYGSLLKIDDPGKEPNLFLSDNQTYNPFYADEMRIWNFKRLLSQKYDVVVTNPPYMGISGMGAKLAQYVKDEYPDSKSDLFAAFIERCGGLQTECGFQSMITMESWMFLSSFESFRGKLFSTKDIINMVHMPYLGKGGTSLGINFGTAAFVIRKSQIKNYAAQYVYIRYFETDDDGIPFAFPTINERYKAATAENFEKIPGCPVAYWISDTMLKAFEVGRALNDIAQPRQGIATADNNRFLRLWSEIDCHKLGLSMSQEQAKKCGRKWFPYNKGGDFRKWYGNNDFVVNWENEGAEMKAFKNSVIRNPNYHFRESITWTLISSASTAFRYKPKGHLFDVAGMSMFPPMDKLNYIFGFCNSVIVREMLMILAPTLNYQVGDIARLPIIMIEPTNTVNELVDKNISLSRADWDSFETSWDFKRHPLVHGVYSRQKALEGSFGDYMVEGTFQEWEREAAERFDTLKRNEEELNRIFIDIYGLQDELTPEVDEKDVTVRRADLGREIRSLISYAVGCMFGRYSLDVEGLAYAGGEWDASKYRTFIPDKDNILPICDDEYFDDDIVGRFVDFVRVVYGAEWLENNLHFIAEALYPSGSGTPREKIRRYFMNDFYTDHCKIYQKRPIYWLFDSGKKNGFKALTYLHRYSRDLLAKLRTDYVHEQQERYRTQLAHVVESLNHATGAERARLLKQQDKLTEQAREIGAYEEKVHHLADQNIEIDLDDGVKKNYEAFADVLAKI